MEDVDPKGSELVLKGLETGVINIMSTDSQDKDPEIELFVKVRQKDCCVFVKFYRPSGRVAAEFVPVWYGKLL